MLRNFIRQSASAALLLLSGSASYAQLTGTKTIPGDYTTLAAAITDLNAQGVGAGGVTINLAQAETAPVGGYLINATGTATNPIVITGTGNPTITAGLQAAGTTNDAIIKVNGGDYITISNMTLTENSGNTVVTPLASQTMTEVGIAIGRATTINGAQNNTITGCTITMRGSTAYTSAYGVYVTSRHDITAPDWTVAGTATAAGGENSNNTFTNNTIDNVTGGFVLLGNNTLNDVGNQVGFASGNGNTITMGPNGFGTTLVVTLSGISSSGDGVQAAGNSNFTASYNTITYSGAVTSTSALAVQQGIFVTSSVAVANSITTLTNNTISMNQSASTAGANVQRGIHVLGGVSTGTANINTNSISLNSGTGVNGVFTGILVAVNTGALNINSNIFPAGTFNATGAVTFINNNGAQTTSATINNNVFTGPTFNAAAVGALTFISNTSGTNNVTVTGNTTSGTTTRAGTSGAITCYTNNGSPGVGTETITNNNFSNFSYTAVNTSAFTGISTTSLTSTTKVVTGNTISGLTLGTSTAAVTLYNLDYLNQPSIVSGNAGTGVTSTGSITGLTVGGSTVAGTVQNNTIGGFSSSGASSTIVGMNASPSTYVRFISNNISNLTATGATAPIVRGIVVTSGTTDTVEANTITGLSITSAATGAGTVEGIRMQSGTTAMVTRNNIYALSTAAVGAGSAIGINFTAGTYSPVTVANNFISGLNAPAAANTQAVVGIAIAPTTTSTYRLYYNTVYLTPSASTATNFGATGVLYPATGGTLDLRNNIINVNATAAGTGTVSALRRASGTANTAPANYAATSNNNIFFAPNATNSYLYSEGATVAATVNGFNLTNDPNFNTPCGLYKTFMTGRDASTFTEDNLTAGTTTGTFAPTGTSFAESNAQSIAGFTTDFSGATRSATSDVGALEFSGTAVDATGPAIAFTALANTQCTNAPTLTATITDAAGVNTTSGTAPRIYFKKASETNAFGTYPTDNTPAFNGFKYVEGVASGSTFTFALDYSLLTSPVAAGDVIQYFVVAQDNAATPNIGINSVGFANCPTSVDITAASGPVTAPRSFTINAPTAVRNDPNTTTAVIPGAQDQQFVRVAVSGEATCTQVVTQIDFAITNPNAGTDVVRAEVFYSTTTTFSTAVPFGTAIVNPATGTATFTGNQTLAAGTNYFFLVFDLTCGATAAASLNADVTSLVVSGTTVTPTGTATAANAVSNAAAINTSIANGDWSDPAIWSCGAPPSTATAPVVIASQVTVTTPGNVAGNVTINTGASLIVTAGDLTMGTSSAGAATGNSNRVLTNNGTLTITSGTLNTNGSYVQNAAGVLNMSAGTWNLDPNDGTAAGSSTTATFSIASITAASQINVTGGAINFLDPAYPSATRTITSSTALILPATGTGNTVTMGGGDDANTSNTAGFSIESSAASGAFEIGNLVVAGGRFSAQRHVSTNTSANFLTKVRNITVNPGAEVVISAAPLAVTGDLVNNGIITTTTTSQGGNLAMVGNAQYNGATAFTASTTAQSITGSGFFKHTTAAADPTAQTGNLMGGLTVYHAPTSPGLTLGMPLTSTGFVQLLNGPVNTTATNFLALGNGTSIPGNPATLTATAGTLYGSAGTGEISQTGGATYATAQAYLGGRVIGAFNRYFLAAANTGQTGIFPIGSDTVDPAQILFTTGPTTAGYLTGMWIPAAGTSPISPSLNEPAVTPSTINRAQNSVWEINSNGLAGGAYTGVFNFRNAPAGNYANSTVVKRANAASPWTLDGTYVATTPTTTTTSPVVSRAGMVGFSQFSIGDNSSVPLTITGINLAAANEGTRNRVTWKAAGEEVEGLRYELERSVDGRSFATIETRASAGTGTEYVHYDLTPANGASYYRVRAVDASGRTALSRTAMAYVANTTGTFALQAFPNPVNDVLTMTVGGTVKGTATLMLTDATGKVLRSQLLSGTTATFDLQALPIGMYLVRYTDGARTETVKVTKQ